VLKDCNAIIKSQCYFKVYVLLALCADKSDSKVHVFKFTVMTFERQKKNK